MRTESRNEDVSRNSPHLQRIFLGKWKSSLCAAAQLKKIQCSKITEADRCGVILEKPEQEDTYAVQHQYMVTYGISYSRIWRLVLVTSQRLSPWVRLLLILIHPAKPEKISFLQYFIDTHIIIGQGYQRAVILLHRVLSFYLPALPFAVAVALLIGRSAGVIVVVLEKNLIHKTATWVNLLLPKCTISQNCLNTIDEVSIACFYLWAVSFKTFWNIYLHARKIYNIIGCCITDFM